MKGWAVSPLYCPDEVGRTAGGKGVAESWRDVDDKENYNPNTGGIAHNEWITRRAAGQHLGQTPPPSTDASATPAAPTSTPSTAARATPATPADQPQRRPLRNLTPTYLARLLSHAATQHHHADANASNLTGLVVMKRHAKQTYVASSHASTAAATVHHAPRQVPREDTKDASSLQGTDGAAAAAPKRKPRRAFGGGGLRSLR